MIQMPRRKVEANPNEVFIDTGDGVFACPKRVDSLKTNTPLDASQYILVQERDGANYALSAKQQLGGLNFVQMNTEALRKGLPLATVKNMTPHYRNVNLALDGKGVIYDASGGLIEGERLIEHGNAINNAWAYLNNAYEKGTGFLGLDVVSIVGLDAEGRPVMQKQPLEECVTDCWADVLGPTNSQGYYTKVAPVQKFERGKTIYASKPVAGNVARLGAVSDGAGLVGVRYPRVAGSWLGGFLRAEGTAQKIMEAK